MLRRIYAFLLVAVMILLCSACGESSPQELLPQTDSSVSSSDTDSESSDPSTETNQKLTAEDVFARSEHLVGLCDQLNGRILVCDLSEEDWTADGAVVWEYYNPEYKHIAGIKFRDSEYWGGKVVIFCYPGGAGILSYETKELLYMTSDIGWNPHSVELLPDGTFIVASSSDNLVSVFAPGVKKASQKLEFPNAHGVLWDPAYDVVWMVGMDQLTAFSLNGTTENPSLSPIGGMDYRTPKTGMHDLAPVYGDPTCLLVTCNAGIMKFDKEKEVFNYSYPGGNLGKNVTYAPGVGLFEDGVLAYTSVREGHTVYESWCTNEVYVYVPLGGVRGSMLVRRAPKDAYYKLRLVNFNYQ